MTQEEVGPWTGSCSQDSQRKAEQIENRELTIQQPVIIGEGMSKS